MWPNLGLRKKPLLLLFVILVICAILAVYNRLLTQLEPHYGTILRSSSWRDSVRSVVTRANHFSTQLRNTKFSSLAAAGRLPWYFQNGTIAPEPSQDLKIWPEESSSDRIVDQLTLTYDSLNTTKTIFAPYRQFGMQVGSEYFEQCPVKECAFVGSAAGADAVIYKDAMKEVAPNQISILFILESPEISGLVSASVNWTATYRSDSDIVAPYEKWVYYDPAVKQKRQTKDYAAGKTKKVAMFVSHCHTKNNRLEYAKQLKKYIHVDIYGSCGELSCSREKGNNCFEMLRREYKFYLSFENTNCRDYITEKFFVNALRNDIIPVAMGAHPHDYQAAAPLHSFIHVDDFPSVADLAEYLLLLDSDDHLYNAYFQWKGTGEFIDTRFFCRVCALMHTSRSGYYADYRKWWKPDHMCRTGSWYS